VPTSGRGAIAGTAPAGRATFRRGEARSALPPGARFSTLSRMRRDPPDKVRETTRPVARPLLEDVEAALSQRFADQRVVVDARTGDDAAWIGAAVPHGSRVHEVEVFARGVDGDGLDGALGVVVDYLHAVVAQLDGDAYLPLDWEGRPIDDGVVFVRGEVRDYAAEEAAARLLGEDPPPRLVR
jgi:hypothetical protein